MRRQYSYRPSFIVQLLKTDLTYVIPVLMKASVLRSGDDAMLIAGLEVHPGSGSKSGLLLAAAMALQAPSRS